jgi:ParB-like chromosome segregation protein Spo0J
MTRETDDELAHAGDAGSISANGIDSLPILAVPLNSIRPGFFLRQSGTDASHVQLLAEAANSDDLPAILVQKSSLRVVDGMHRIEVAKLRGQQSINARFVDCTDEEAFVLAVKSNTLHGLPLSRADRISGAKRILAWHRDWSDRAVAAATGLSTRTIASLRGLSADDEKDGAKRLGRDGKRRPVTGAEGRKRAAEYLATHPDAPLRQVAKETDVSIGTVHDIRGRLRRGEDPTAVGSRRSPGKQTANGSPAANGPLPLNGMPPPGNGMFPAASDARLLASPRALLANGRTMLTDGTDPLTNGTSLLGNAMSRAANGAKLLANGTASSANGTDRCGKRRNDIAPTWPSISNKLASDPTVKYTECGREFLRWMAMRAISPDEWDKFVAVVPAHWGESVSLVAQGVSDAWREFADQLREREFRCPE